MFSTLRKFLVVFLTLLQFIAPLVHAHAREYSLKPGLHVPGLEHISAEHNTPLAQNKTLPHHVSVDGMIVAVDTGVKQSQTNHPADSASDYFLPQQALAFNAAAFRFDTHFSPQSQQSVYRLLIPSPPPRAPPAH
ncbi:MAG: hypothetical protein WCP96_11790 [Methylococcaceae bacterium]